MQQPNFECAGFCNWMLNISAQHLSGPQRQLVELVYNAAVAVTPVSDQQWYNFNLFAAWRNKYYLVYRDYILATPNPVTAWYNYLTVQPSPQYKQVIEVYAQALVASGNWSRHDRIFVRATETEQQATVPIINPASTPAVFNGGYTFTANQGVSGNGADAYINNSFNLFTDCTNYSLGSACMWFYVRSSSGAQVIMTGANTGSVINDVRFSNSGFPYVYLNQGGLMFPGASPAYGLFSAVIKAGNTGEIWYNGVRVNTQVLTPTTVANATLLELAFDGAGIPSLFANAEIAMSGYGNGDIDQIQLYADTQAFATGIGFDV